MGDSRGSMGDGQRSMGNGRADFIHDASQLPRSGEDGEEDADDEEGDEGAPQAMRVGPGAAAKRSRCRKAARRTRVAGSST